MEHDPSIPSCCSTSINQSGVTAKGPSGIDQPLIPDAPEILFKADRLNDGYHHSMNMRHEHRQFFRSQGNAPSSHIEHYRSTFCISLQHGPLTCRIGNHLNTQTLIGSEQTIYHHAESGFPTPMDLCRTKPRTSRPPT